MSDWAAFADQMTAKSPGSDEGFSQEDIARDAQADFSKLSIWAIICQEVLDTQFPRVYFERAREEQHAVTSATTRLERCDDLHGSPPVG